MKNDDCEIPIITQIIGWILVSLTGLYFFGAFLGYKKVNEFLVEHGSLIAGVMALIAAGMAIYFQGKNIERQIKSSKDLEYAKVKMQKFEELLLQLSYLKIKMEAIRDKMGINELDPNKISLEIEVRDKLLSMRAIAILYDFSQKNEIYVLSVLSEILVYSGIYTELATEMEDEKHDSDKLETDLMKLSELKSDINSRLTMMIESKEFIAVKDQYFIGLEKSINSNLDIFSMQENGLVGARGLESDVLITLSETRSKIYADLVAECTSLVE